MSVLDVYRYEQYRAPSPIDPRAIEAMRAVRALRKSQPNLCAFIYAIQAGDVGPVKIGVTDSPADRIKTLQQGNHEELRGIAAWWDLKEVEKAIHREFAYARIRGEWFRPVPDLMEYVLLEGCSFCDWEKE